MPTALFVDEPSARQVLLLRAFESDAAPTWSADDRDWATRVARASLGDAATPAAFVVERARHAMQRLAPREAGVALLLRQRFALGAWSGLALVLGLGLGLAVDQIGPDQRINLLAPPIWGLLLWNLGVYAVIILHPLGLGGGKPGRWRRLLQSLWLPRGLKTGPLQRFATDWTAFGAALNGARAAWLLHLAAAALAAGVVGGLYLRGLVLDYRAGWESSFLEPAPVQRSLQWLLAPASALTGIAVPDTEALALQRVSPGHPAQAAAAPWLHLYAAMLALVVIAPRLALALLALARVMHLRRHLALPVQEPYFQRLLQQAQGRRASVWLLPHAAPASAQAVLGLQALLQPLHEAGLQLQVAPPVAYGDEDQAAPCTPPPGCTLVAVLFDLGSTPEAEVHGRLLDTLAQAAAGLPRLVVVDESAFLRRFGSDLTRCAQRRQAWQGFVQARGLQPLLVDLLAPGPQAADAVRQALA